MPRSSFLHAGGFGFGDVLVVGLVLQFPAEVLDCFIQAFFQWHLQTHKHAHKASGDRCRGASSADRRRELKRYEAGLALDPLAPEEPFKKT